MRTTTNPNPNPNPPLDVRIEELGPPDRIIAGFAPELYGAPLNDDDVMEQAVVDKGGLRYYQWLVRPHRWVRLGGGVLGGRMWGVWIGYGWMVTSCR